VPAAFFILELDFLGVPGNPLLGGGALRGFQRRRVRRKRFGENAIDLVRPAAVVLDNFIRAPRTIMFLLRDRQHARFGGQLADDLTPVRLRRMPPASC